MTCEHTPGPWVIQTKEESNFEQYIVGGNNVLVADVYADTADDLGIPSIKECRANARLIAAALDLLTAARLAIAVIDAQNLDDHESVETYLALTAAINKATKGG